MNTLAKIAISSALLGQAAMGEIEIPKHVHSFGNLKQAQLEAAEKEKPLVFVITDQGTDCKTTTAASLVAFKDFKSLGVLVHFDHLKNQGQEGPPGFERIKNAAGVNLPFALVTTADGQRGVHAISAKAIHADPGKAAREAKRKLSEIDVVGDMSQVGTDDGDKAENGKPATGKKDKSKNNQWTNTEGKTMTATPLEINGDNVKFRLPNGRTVIYPMDKLSEDSQKALLSYFDDL